MVKKSRTYSRAEELQVLSSIATEFWVETESNLNGGGGKASLENTQRRSRSTRNSEISMVNANERWTS